MVTTRRASRRLSVVVDITDTAFTASSVSDSSDGAVVVIPATPSTRRKRRQPQGPLAAPPAKRRSTRRSRNPPALSETDTVLSTESTSDDKPSPNPAGILRKSKQVRRATSTRHAGNPTGPQA
ncbi:hypothetical protein H4R35_006104, partial [Dimargaris xerosporica]